MPMLRVHSNGNGRSLALTGEILALSVTTVILGAATADMSNGPWTGYQRRWAKARFACAILCVSSFFLTTEPVLLYASMISAAKASFIGMPLRLVAASTIQRSARDS